MPDLSDEQITEFKEAFLRFDKEGEGKMATKQLGTLMRSLGQSPTEGELRAMLEFVDPTGGNTIDFPQFCNLMEEHMKPPKSSEEIKECFRVFDREHNGYIPVDKLRNALTSQGDSLNEAEIEELIRESDIDGDGMIRYSEFVDRMID